MSKMEQGIRSWKRWDVTQLKSTRVVERREKAQKGLPVEKIFHHRKPEGYTNGGRQSKLQDEEILGGRGGKGSHSRRWTKGSMVGEEGRVTLAPRGLMGS